MKKVLILGYGVTGKATHNFLKGKYELYVIDEKKIKDKDVKQIDYDYLIKNLPLFDFTVRSPGFDIHNKEFEIIRILSKEVISEIELAYRFLKQKKSKIIAVTGSNGKTTVATLIYELIKIENKNVHLLGNIGTPLISKINEIKPNSYVVLELSNFQLEDICNFDFTLGIITNLSPNHLDHVPSLAYYLASKKRLLLNINNQIVLTDNDKYFEDYKSNIINIKKNCILKQKQQALYYLDNLIVKKKDLKNQTGYILEDITYALLTMIILFGFKEKYIEVIKNFVGVKYRQEEIRVNDVVFVNDGKSTTIESLINAIDNYKKFERIIIMGGVYKSSGATRIKFKNDDLILLYGKDAKILRTLLKRGLEFDTLNDILNYLKKEDLRNKVVIYSPACSSFDQYHNYIERSKEFERYIKENYYVSK